MRLHVGCGISAHHSVHRLSKYVCYYSISEFVDFFPHRIALPSTFILFVNDVHRSVKWHIAYRIVRRSTLIIHIIHSLALSICILELIFRLSVLFGFGTHFTCLSSHSLFSSLPSETRKWIPSNEKYKAKEREKKTITHENSSTLTKLIDSLKPVRIESSFLCMSIFSIFGNSCCCCCC